MVSWILLGLASVVAFFTLNAFLPVRRNRILFLPSFVASWLTIEFAWWHLLWEVVVAAGLVALGALDAWPGVVGLVLLGVNWVALAVIIVQSRATATLAEAALAGLGGEVPGHEHHSPIHRERNVPYTRVGGRTLELDVYAPRAPGTGRPAILQIHGGAWMVGDKREQGIPLLKYLAAQGWVCFNANYRLSPGATWPDHLVDLKTAVRWIREHAGDYGVDPSFVAVTGGSAGGHLAAMLALTAGDPEYQPGFEDADTSVQAAVPFYGVYDFTNRAGTMPPEFLSWFLEPMIMKRFLADEPEAFHRASPIDRVHPDAPPFFVVHGDNDTLAPVEDARAFVARLREVSRRPVYYLELHGAQHAFDMFTSIRTRRVVKAVHRFLHAMHQEHLAARSGGGPVSGQPSPDRDPGLPAAVRATDRADQIERAAS